jgi:hypothetical protein
MGKIKPNKNRTLSLNSLIRNLGTNAGTFISILTLLGMGFSAGSYYNDFKKNIEILDIQKENFKEIKDLNSKIEVLITEKKEILVKLKRYEKE